MSDKKELKFSIVVDERAAQAAKRVIRELIADSERLVKTLANVSIGGLHGGGLISGGSVGGAQTQGQMTAAAQSPRQTGPGAGQQRTLSQVFVESGKSIKDLANISRDSMRVMSDGIKRAVDEQKRSIAELDDDLEGLAKRYKEVTQAKNISIAGGMPADTIQRLSINQDALSERQQDLLAKRETAHKDLNTLDERRRQLAIAQGGPPPDDGGEGGGGGGFGGRLRGAFGKGARWGVIGGAVVAGVAAGAQDLSQQPFDFISNQARHAQAMSTMGVSTLQGDLRYTAALSQVMRDADKRKEFLHVGDQNITTGINNTLGSVMNVATQGPGGIFRGIESIDTTMKERLRHYMEEQIKTDPRFYANLERFQSEADARVGLARRVGYNPDKSPWATSGEDMGTYGSAFEAVRSGGRSFAQSALWQAMRATRGGMDMGAAGSLLTAGAPSGTSTQLFNAVTAGNDVVASEHLARAIAQAMNATAFGPSAGLGLAGAVGNFGNSPMDVYRASQMGAGTQAFGGVLGGGDPLGVGINVLAANKIAGKGGDLYKVNAMTELLKDPAALLDAMAGNDEGGHLQAVLGSNFQADAKSLFRESMTRNIRARYIDQGESANMTPSTRAMQTLVKKYGGDIGAMMEGEQAAGRNANQLLTEIGGGLHSIMPTTVPTVQAGEAAARLFAGAGNTGNIFGKGPGDASFGSAAGEFRKDRNKTTEDEFQKFVGANTEFIKQMSQDMKTVGNIFDRMGGIDISADAAAKSLMALAGAADAMTRKWGGTPPERASDDLNKLRVQKEGEMAQEKAGIWHGIRKSDAEKVFRSRTARDMASPDMKAAFKHWGLH